MNEHLTAYLEAVNSHDIDRIMNHLSEDFQLRFAEFDMTLGKAQMRDVLGWDKGVNGGVTFEPSSSDDQSVTGILTEQNDFFRQLGIETLQAETTFRFDTSGKLVTQTYRVLPGQKSFQQELEPAIEWARNHRAEALVEMYPENQIPFNEEMGKRWVALLQEWRTESRDQ